MQKGYYAIIPASVRYDKSICPNAKLLYAEITALANDKGYCYATNSYFAGLYEVSKYTISRWISSLKEKGYIQTQIIYKEDSKQVKERRLYLTGTKKIVQEQTYTQEEKDPINNFDNTPIDEKSNTLYTKSSIPYCEKEQHPIDEKSKENNKRLILNNNNKKEKVKKEKKLSGLDLIINSYSENEEVKNTLYDFIQMRKEIKKPLTQRALKIVLKKLDELSNNDEKLKIKHLEQSIENCWKSVFELKDNSGYIKQDSYASKEERQTNSNFDIKIKQSEDTHIYTDEELKELGIE